MTRKLGRFSIDPIQAIRRAAEVTPLGSIPPPTKPSIQYLECVLDPCGCENALATDVGTKGDPQPKFFNKSAKMSENAIFSLKVEFSKMFDKNGEECEFSSFRLKIGFLPFLDLFIIWDILVILENFQKSRFLYEGKKKNRDFGFFEKQLR